MRRVESRDPVRLFEKDLPYEIWMLDGTMEILRKGKISPIQDNANIESFCTHARNLIRFFKNKDKVDPSQYTKEHFKPKYLNFKIGVREKLDAQISHILLQREDDPAKKITAEDRESLHAAIKKEVDHFYASLKEEWHKKLKAATPVEYVFKPGPPGASAEITIVGPTISTYNYEVVEGMIKIDTTKNPAKLRG